MATGLVGQHQIATFVSPVNGTTPIDANQVRGNDNTIKTSYDAHDNDTTIHFQSSTLAARPVASTAGQKWMTSDGFRIYYDDGSAWNEAAYLPTAGGTVSGNVTITGTLTQTGLATFNGGATIASGQALTVTGATITGLTAASVGAGTFAAGNFTFPASVTWTTKLLFGTAGASDSSPLQIQRTGSWFAGVYNTTVGNAVLNIGPVASATVIDFDAFGFSNSAAIGIYFNRTSGGKVTFGGKVNMPNLPTSATGLSAGDLWNSSGVVHVV